MYKVFVYEKGNYDKELYYMELDELPRIGEMFHYGNETSDGKYNIDWETGWRIVDIDYYYGNRPTLGCHCREVDIEVERVY